MPTQTRAALILAAVSAGTFALQAAGHALTLLSVYTARGGHPPLAAILWVVMVMVSWVLAPIGVSAGVAALLLGVRSKARPSGLAIFGSIANLAVLIGVLLLR